MSKATNKALELYPEPPLWVPAQGIKREPSPEEAEANKRSVLLRSSILCDEWPRMVRAFRTVMNLPLPETPTPLEPLDKQFHVMLLQSELSEFAAADGVIEQADGLIDIIYVAIGALKHLGLKDNVIQAGFAEVHASNMTKVQDNGRPLINDGHIAPDEPIGKVLKTHNYVRPSLAEAMSLKKTDE